MAIFTKRNVIGVTAAAALATTTLIVPWEGLSLKTYRDPIGILTYCYGETRDAKAGRTYTQPECKSILEKRVAEFETQVIACMPNYGQLPLEVKASVISITYNAGAKAMCNSTMFRKLRAGDLKGACMEFPKWNRAGGQVLRGLSNRRAAEMAVCLKGLN